MKLRPLFFALACAAAVRAADVLPVFNATLTVGKEHRFVLIDAGGKASSFLGLGESFAGYKLKGYDPKTGVLELEQDGKVSRVSIVADAAVTNAPGAKAPATIADAEGVLNKMHFEEMMDRALQGQRKVLAAQFQKMTGQMTEKGADPADVAGFQKRLTDEIFSALDAKSLKDDVSKIYSEVFTKQELDDLAAFYTTPVGQMLTAKQMDVQEKMGVVMQTRMADMMPRIQKLSQEFAADQKAKRAAAGGAPTPAPAPKGKQ
jgi:hypothetical protein